MSNKTFILFFSSEDIDEFRSFTRIAARLKAHGRVQVNVSSQFDKAWFEVPEGGNPWHEYTSKHAALWKFFPHPKLAPFLPADWVERNQAYLREKVAALSEHGLDAFFWTSEPHYMPEAFFVQYPHLRGPRVDHPRRSKVPAFSMCVDHPEALEMIEWMTRELKKQVPQLSGYLVNIDDAGSGVCWSDTLYSGANGPDACRTRTIGVRIRTLIDTLRRGAEHNGGKVDMHLSGNIPRHQLDRIRPNFPEDAFLHDGHSPEIERMTAVQNGTVESFPIKGLLKPLTVLKSLERLNDPKVDTVMIDFRAHYDRGDDSLDVVDQVVTLVEAHLSKPFPAGRLNCIRNLRDLCSQWYGDEQADATAEAFMAVDEAMHMCHSLAMRDRIIYPEYCGVALRYITRPLLVKPDVLSPEEEAYFLPYVFNIHEHEARNDYTDFTGTRMPRISYTEGRDAITIPPFQKAIAALRKAADVFESASKDAQMPWLKPLPMLLRLRVSVLRSFHNFYCAQIIRDRIAPLLADEPPMHEKAYNLLGESGNLAWKRLMRDEMDNANGLISLLENGGLELLATAKDAKHTDMFQIEPDVVDSIRKKVALMQKHWLDIDRYLASPMK